MGDDKPGLKRKRSSIACKRCNQRRVRCDAATKGAPCTACETRGFTDCEFIESKRVRGFEKRVRKREEEKPKEPAVIKEFTKEREREVVSGTSDGMTAQAAVVEKGPPDSALQDDGRDANMWSQLIHQDSHKLERPGSTSVVKDSGQIAYLGESWTLSYVIHQTDPAGGQLHMSLDEPSQQHDETREVEHELLKRKGAFTVPPFELQLGIVHAYFRYFHPAYPILDQHSFMSAFYSRKCSLLLLQCVLAAGVAHCEDKLITQLGFQNRLAAKCELNRRARALIDSDVERDRVIIIQAAFLLQFYWDSPTEPKDTWHWVSVSIHQAQSLGMHRSTAGSRLSTSNRKLWRRIWWCLYIRDRHSSSALGKPLTINDDDCDVEPLSPDDFPIDEPEDHVQYAIAMVKLSHVITSVIHCEFRPGSHCFKSNMTRAHCHMLLEQWVRELPSEMRLGAGSGRKISFWVHILHMSYNMQLLLLHRPIMQKKTGLPVPNDMSARFASTAAMCVTRIAEDLMTHSSLEYCPIHCLSAVFAAMTYQVVEARSTDVYVRERVRKDLAICMMAIRQFERAYHVASWIARTFQKVMDVWPSVKIDPHTELQKGDEQQFQSSGSSESEDEDIKGESDSDDDTVTRSQPRESADPPAVNTSASTSASPAAIPPFNGTSDGALSPHNFDESRMSPGVEELAVLADMLNPSSISGSPFNDVNNGHLAHLHAGSEPSMNNPFLGIEFESDEFI